jgi:hypothetical protein
LSFQGCCNYFARKLNYWNNCREGCDINEYVYSEGTKGISKELELDRDFQRLVCPLILAYHKSQQKSIIWSIVSDASALARGNLLQPTIGIIIGAALLACGYKEEGQEKIGLLLLAIILAGAFGFASAFDGKIKKGKMKRMRR